jgi:hypothetical protein
MLIMAKPPSVATLCMIAQKKSAGILTVIGDIAIKLLRL